MTTHFPTDDGYGVIEQRDAFGIRIFSPTAFGIVVQAPRPDDCFFRLYRVVEPQPGVLRWRLVAEFESSGTTQWVRDRLLAYPLRPEFYSLVLWERVEGGVRQRKIEARSVASPSPDSVAIYEVREPSDPEDATPSGRVTLMPPPGLWPAGLRRVRDSSPSPCTSDPSTRRAGHTPYSSPDS